MGFNTSTCLLFKLILELRTLKVDKLAYSSNEGAFGWGLLERVRESTFLIPLFG